MGISERRTFSSFSVTIASIAVYAISARRGEGNLLVVVVIPGNLVNAAHNHSALYETPV